MRDTFGSPGEARRAIRSGRWTGPTAGLVPGIVQANLAIVPDVWADEFELLCQRNPQALPLLERGERGSPAPHRCGAEADLRSDVPKYRVYRDGKPGAVVDGLAALWRDDFVAFLLGCSFTFESLLQSAGIEMRHTTLGRNVPMYVTTRSLQPTVRLHGPLVVSMRPIPTSDVDRVVRITARIPGAHGAPVHVGDPEHLGIQSLERPEFGDPVPVRKGEEPVFWACGVTAQAVAQASRIPLMITHAPGHMFITDLPIQSSDLLDGPTH